MSAKKEAVVLKIVDSIREDEPRVGTRKLQDRLRKRGKYIGRDALFSLMRQYGKLVKPYKSFRKTTYSRHSYAVAPNRVKHLRVSRPKQVLVSDITYLRLRGSRAAYLFLVTDLYSRQIMGYHVSRDLSHYSALLALDNARKKMGEVQDTIHHSDRGCQYCCHEYLSYLRRHSIIPSMTDASHCYQNSVAERVNGILKIDLGLDSVFDRFDQVKTAVDRAVNVYNTKRTHWSLGLMTPEEAYDQAA